MRFGPLPGTVPATPILRQDTAQYFVHPNTVEPWRIADSENATSALKFGARFSLLTISQDDDLLLTGTMSPCDVLDSNLSLGRVYYRAKFGDVRFIDTTDHVFSYLNPATGQNFAEFTLNFTVRVNKFGIPRSWLSRLVDKVCQMFKYDVTATIKVTGTVNLQTGIAQLDASTEDFDIRPIGYTLRAYRRDPNRQYNGHAGHTGDPAKCPYMN